MWSSIYFRCSSKGSLTYAALLLCLDLSIPGLPCKAQNSSAACFKGRAPVWALSIAVHFQSVLHEFRQGGWSGLYYSSQDWGNHFFGTWMVSCWGLERWTDRACPSWPPIVSLSFHLIVSLFHVHDALIWTPVFISLALFHPSNSLGGNGTTGDCEVWVSKIVCTVLVAVPIVSQRFCPKAYQ